MRELLKQLPEPNDIWVNVNGCGHFNRTHTHQGPFNRSAVYFVAGESGALVFEPGEFAIEPRPGLLVTFPSSMRHRVEPNQSDTLRISIALNFTEA